MMGRWLQKPSLQHVKGRLHVVTIEGVYVGADGTRYVVPVGFVTDGASVPRLLWVLYPPFGGDYEGAAVLHDYVYAHAERFAGSDDGHMSRGEGDALMLEVMTVDGFRPAGRRVVYRGVRVGGWKAWRTHRTRAREEAQATA